MDRYIVDQLRVDGRLPFSEIARRIGASEATVRRRYNPLVTLGVIWVAGMYDKTKIGGIAAHLGIRVAELPVTIRLMPPSPSATEFGVRLRAQQ